MKYVKLSTFSSFIFVGEVSLVSSPIFTEVRNSVPVKLGDSKFDFFYPLSGVHKSYFCHVQSSPGWKLLKYFLRVNAFGAVRKSCCCAAVFSYTYNLLNSHL